MIETTIYTDIYGTRFYSRELKEAKMIKFEVGDTVQVVKADYEERQSAALSVCNYNLMANTGVIIAETDRDGDCFVRFSEQVRFVPAAWLKLVKKAEKHWSGKVVCINNSPCSAFKTGKVYTIKDGMLWADNVVSFGGITGIKGVDDLNERCTWSKFMEFKGFADEGKDKNE